MADQETGLTVWVDVHMIVYLETHDVEVFPSAAAIDARLLRDAESRFGGDTPERLSWRRTNAASDAGDDATWADLSDDLKLRMFLEEVEGILFVHEARMEVDVALLTPRI